MLILLSGLPGTGKTTLARAFSARIGALHLNSDLVRSQLGLLGHYSKDEKKQVYDALLEKCHQALLAGRVVVLDSTFYNESIRAPFRELAEKNGIPLHWVELRAQEATIRERVSKPRPDSEADFAVYEKIRDAAEPIPDPHLVLWSDEATLDAMVDSMLYHLPLESTQSRKK